MAPKVWWSHYTEITSFFNRHSPGPGSLRTRSSLCLVAICTWQLTSWPHPVWLSVAVHCLGRTGSRDSKNGWKNKQMKWFSGSLIDWLIDGTVNWLVGWLERSYLCFLWQWVVYSEVKVIHGLAWVHYQLCQELKVNTMSSSISFVHQYDNEIFC